jgi:hypothetical protein
MSKAKNKIQYRNNQQKIKVKRKIQVATGKRLTPKRKKQLIKVSRKGEQRGARFGKVEVKTQVISKRGRMILPGGITDPFSKPLEGMPQSIQDYFLGSRAIRRMAYSISRGILEIIFTTGYGYHFYNVPYDVWNNFQEAQSKGQFFHKHIYGEWRGPEGDKTYFPNYTYRRIQ